jgi:hypothetical protein
MSSGCGIPVSVLDEAGNAFEIFVDHVVNFSAESPSQQVDASTKIK